MISQPRQPLHLSASTLIVLIFFLTLGHRYEYPSLLQVVGDVAQIQLLQPLPGGDAVVVPPLERVVRGQELLFELGEPLLPVVRRRLLVGPRHAAPVVDRPVQVPAPVDDLLQARPRRGPCPSPPRSASGSCGCGRAASGRTTPCPAQMPRASSMLCSISIQSTISRAHVGRREVRDRLLALDLPVEQPLLHLLVGQLRASP